MVVKPLISDRDLMVDDAGRRSRELMVAKGKKDSMKVTWRESYNRRVKGLKHL